MPCIQALTKVCKSCQAWEQHKGTDKYDEYLKTHDCPINHHGSAGLMEASGTIQCFNRFVATNKLRYTTYIGDGDMKAYPDLVKADPYPGTLIEKGECVGHVQKRVGKRLRKSKEKTQ